MESPSNIPVIVKHLLTLSQYKNVSKELNLVSFFGHSPRFSIHVWKIVDGQKRAGKGLTLTDMEMKALLEGIAEHGDNHLSTDVPDASSNSVESDSTIDALTTGNPELTPQEVYWDVVEQAYRIIYSSE